MIVNEEIRLYQQISNQLPLTNVWKLVKMTPHAGQAPMVESFDADDYTNAFVMTLGRRTGKSSSTAITAIRELLIPFSNTVLLSPSYRNSKILFDEVHKHVLSLKLPIRAINKNQFTIELENGAKFGSFTQNNVESALGSRISLLIVDETQSMVGLIDILENLLFPMLLDYGVKANGTLYANMIFLGTPRGVGTEFHELYLKEKGNKNWKSFSAPSWSNPLLPAEYIEEQRNVLSERAFKQEIEAQWLTTGAGVFYAFDDELNVYDPDELLLDGGNFILGFDFGAMDSTCMAYIYVNQAGEYYVHDLYMANMRTTQQHVTSFKEMIVKHKGKQVGSWGDPSAAQSMLDLRNTYDFYIAKANNNIAPAVTLINELFEPTGANRRPKLYINKNLTELITQIQLITYKNGVGRSSTSGDPFNKHRDHHFDAVHAMRYAIYSHFRQQLSGLAIVS